MPYVAKLFREVTGRNLSGLSHFTGWIGIGGYYHWRVVQQGLVHQVPHLAGQPAPRTPDAHPSGKSLPPKLPQTETPSTGASGKQQDRSHSPQREQTGTHPEPGWTAAHLRPEQNDRSTQAKWKVIHSPPGW